MKDFVPPIYAPRKTLMERLEDALLPLINLVFLLLMFFIVAGQLQDRALPTLPDTATNQSTDQPEADLIVTATGNWQVAGQTVSAEKLTAALPSAEASPTLTIGVDAETRITDLERLFGLLEDAGFEDVVLLTEPSAS